MELTAFHYFLGFIALFMLIYNTIEVGRNDAANIVNAVFGAKVLDAKRAILLAGLAVIVGAVAASPVMETARKGISLTRVPLGTCNQPSMSIWLFTSPIPFSYIPFPLLVCLSQRLPVWSLRFWEGDSPWGEWMRSIGRKAHR